MVSGRGLLLQCSSVFPTLCLRTEFIQNLLDKSKIYMETYAKSPFIFLFFTANFVYWPSTIARAIWVLHTGARGSCGALGAHAGWHTGRRSEVGGDGLFEKTMLPQLSFWIVRRDEEVEGDDLLEKTMLPHVSFWRRGDRGRRCRSCRGTSDMRWRPRCILVRNRSVAYLFVVTIVI